MKSNVPKVEQRQMGRVHVFDMFGALSGERSHEVIEKIDHTIVKKKLKRVILNLKGVTEMDDIACRRIVASVNRPQKSLIYCTDEKLQALFKSNYLPHNVTMCTTETEIADLVGSFLFDKEKNIGLPKEQAGVKTPYGIERRRKKRIRVAIPIEIEFETKDGKKIHSHAIATNISQGGLFAEYLDLDASLEISELCSQESTKVKVIVPPSENFPEKVEIPCCVKRVELLKRQVGMGIQFL